MPYAFTEQGVAMLSGLLNSDNDINEDTRIQLDLINETLAELQAKKKESEKPRKPIGFVIPQNPKTEE